MEQKIDKLNDKFNEVDKTVAVLVVKLNNYLDKIDEIDEEQKKEIDDIKKDLKQLKEEMAKIKKDTEDNSKIRKITNSIVWLTFSGLVGLVFFYIKEKMKGN